MLSPLTPARRALRTLLFAALALPALPAASRAQQGERVPAPELDGGTGWVGVDKPLHLKDLRGKIVVLDFWTQC
jgi:hypothetical protein